MSSVAEQIEQKALEYVAAIERASAAGDWRATEALYKLVQPRMDIFMAERLAAAPEGTAALNQSRGIVTAGESIPPPPPSLPKVVDE